MPVTDSVKRNERGQTLMLAIILLSLSSTLMLGLFKVSLACQEKIRLQISADLAVQSALNSQANALNSIAIANRAILANDALAGQLNALVSETTFYRRLVDKFRKLLRFIPYIGPVSRFVSAGIHTIEKTARRAASLSLPLARYSNTALRKGQEAIRILIPVSSLRSAKSTVGENTHGAKVSRASEALILQQARSLQRSIVPLDAENVRTLKEKTMDRHTLRRDWRIKIAGISPVKKTGSTTIAPTDLNARDELRMKVFKRLRWRWKTVLSSKSKASDYHYRSPADLLSLNPESAQTALSLSILISSVMPASTIDAPFKERKLFALSAGRIFYRRHSRVDEKPNLFNPFWRSELIPVASEPNAKRLIPGGILSEVTH